MANYLFRLFKHTESWLIVIILVISLFFSLTAHSFFTTQNFVDLLNNYAVQIIFACGLFVVLVARGIDISFIAIALVSQYILASFISHTGIGNWTIAIIISLALGILLGAINAFLIYYFKVISIIITISTMNIFFGMLMFISKGRSIYDLPDWWLDRVEVFSIGGASVTLPVVFMSVVIFAAWILTTKLRIGRQIYALGNNEDAARRQGLNIGLIYFVVYCWIGACAAIAGLVNVHLAQEFVPNALYGKELDILAAVVLGGASLQGGKGSVWGAVLGVLLIAIINNGLILMGVSNYAFKAILGVIILVALIATHIQLPKNIVRVES
ncbi:MAG: ABC transporter permease [Alphaproteobacteria bacterium]